MRTVMALSCLLGVAADLITQEPATLGELEPAAGPCEEMLSSSETTLAVGAYVPQCTAGGEYAARQCHGSTGYCWCVDTANVRISEEFRSWEEEDEADCTALRQETQAGGARLGRAAGEAEPEPDTEDENDEKLGLLGMLAFVCLVVLPFVLAFVLRRTCAKPDHAGSKTSLVNGDSGEQGSDEDDTTTGQSDAKSETTPLSSA